MNPLEATGLGALIALGVIVVAIGIYVFLRKNELFLSPSAKGGIFLGGGIVAGSGMLLPIYIEHYNPPKGFPTIINHHTVTPFTRPSNAIEIYHLTTDPTGLGFLQGFLWTILLTSIIGLLLVIGGVGLIRWLRRGSKGLSLPMILFLIFVIFVNFLTGDLASGPKENFVAMLGGGSVAQQAANYYTVTSGIGLWLLVLGIIAIVFATYAPHETQTIENPGRDLTIAIVVLLINIVLAIYQPPFLASFEKNAFGHWVASLVIIGIFPSAVSVLGAFRGLSGEA